MDWWHQMTSMLSMAVSRPILLIGMAMSQLVRSLTYRYATSCWPSDGGDAERGAQRRRQHTGGQNFEMENFEASFQIGGTSSDEDEGSARP